MAAAVQCQCKLQGAKSLVAIAKVYKATQSKNKWTNKAMYVGPKENDKECNTYPLMF